MPDIGSQFLATSSRYLTTSCFDKIERAAPLLADEDLWWRPNDASNSIGNLLLHLAGSLRFWIVSVAGGAPSDRVRDLEFDTRGGPTKDELLATLRLAVDDAVEVLGRLTPDELLQTRSGFKGETLVLDAIHHGVAHFAMHTGQILQLIKIRKGAALDLPL